MCPRIQGGGLRGPGSTSSPPRPESHRNPTRHWRGRSRSRGSRPTVGRAKDGGEPSRPSPPDRRRRRRRSRRIANRASRDTPDVIWRHLARVVPATVRSAFWRRGLAVSGVTFASPITALFGKPPREIRPTHRIDHAQPDPTSMFAKSAWLRKRTRLRQYPSQTNRM